MTYFRSRSFPMGREPFRQPHEPRPAVPEFRAPPPREPQGLIAEFLRLGRQRPPLEVAEQPKTMRWPIHSQATTPQADGELPDPVVNSFREALDDAGLAFLKHGPRSRAESLAFAQQIDPRLYRSAEVAPDDEQYDFRRTGRFDRNRNFVGPDLSLYRRPENVSEPLAQRLRRGMDRAVGGFDRPDIGAIVRAVFISPAVGDDRPMDRGIVPGAQGKLDAEPLPLPPPVPEVRPTADKFMAIANDVEKQGLDVGAAAMKHFIYGEGRPIEYAPQMFRSFPVVQKAESKVQKYIQNWILATHPREPLGGVEGYGLIDSKLENIKADLLGMKDGQTLHRGSHWDTRFPYSRRDLGFQATHIHDLTSDANLFGMTGEAMLRSDAGLTFQRRGNRIAFNGNVEHNFDERFAFENDGRDSFYAPASESVVPWEFTQEEGVALQDWNVGKPYRTFSRWTTPVSGSLVIGENGGLRLERIDWGEAGPRQHRRDIP